MDAAEAITDAGNDNGIDAIFFDEPNRRLYLVQSKWITDGSGEPENADVKKFVAGVRDLFNLRFDRFNSKVANKQAVISAALNDPATRFEVILAHTGASKLAQHSTRDLADLAEEFNDISEVLFNIVLNQSELHKSLTLGIAGEPISLQIGLKDWGRKAQPQEAYYGQVSCDQVSTWWAQHRQRLFAGNLRGSLGETDVNAEMRQTIEQRPTAFWYFNNGITLVSKRVTRAMAGGAGNDFSTFHCEDISVVNGAQTVTTIGEMGEANPALLKEVYVQTRIIVRGNDQGFADDVTRTNNRQNRIEGRDFVTLDPEQIRIRTELAIDGIDYQLMRTNTVHRSETAFDFIEAATALACASNTIRLPVQLKREIGKLWEDLSKAPYKELFNPSVPGLYVWRTVQVQRRIDKSIETLWKNPASWRELGVLVHGNRIIAALTFEALPVVSFRDPGLEIDSVASDTQIMALVSHRTGIITKLLEEHYSNSIVPTLFKNLSKCEFLAKRAREKLATS